MARKLNKKEAYELVTPIVDGETNDEERKAFFEYIDADRDVRMYYEEELWLKQLVQSKVTYEPAPEHLKSAILRMIARMSESEHVAGKAELPVRGEAGLAGIADTPEPFQDVLKYALRFSYGLAALLALSLFLYIGYALTYNPANNLSAENGLPALEERVYEFFVANEGRMITPDVASVPVDNLQNVVSRYFIHNYHVPKLQDVILVGAVQSEFLPEYHIPLFEYKADYGDIIYIFAFHIPELDRRLSRSAKAVTHCVGDSDYYIDTIQEMDLVSWKWDDFWYVGISNHDGETLASLLPR